MSARTSPTISNTTIGRWMPACVRDLFGGPRREKDLPANRHELIDAWPERLPEGSWMTTTIADRMMASLEQDRAGLDDVVAASPAILGNLELLGRLPLERASLLDVGCGNGVYRDVLAADARFEGWHYAGSEVNPEVVARCRSAHSGTRFEVNDGDALPFEDREFDVILASGVLQYVRQAERMLKELARVSTQYVIVSRLLTWRDRRSSVVLQTVRTEHGVERYPLHVFNRAAFEIELNRLCGSIVFADEEDRRLRVRHVSEPVIPRMYIIRPAHNETA